LQTLLRKEKGINTLIEMGRNGHYPLFDSQWMYECFDEWNEARLTNQKRKFLTGNERVQARKILQRILQHRTIERQKTILFALKKEDRNLFMRAFFQMVEGRILDHKPQIH
jgi:hypothetical protein